MQVDIRQLQPGQVFDLGEMVFSEEEIIDFARRYDPLPFHTDAEYARKSHFGGLVASGPHIFNAYYLREWVPRFGHSVFAGRGVEKWEMLKPVYSGQRYRGRVEVVSVTPKPGKGYAVVEWKFVFTNEAGEEVQRLLLVVMHQWKKL